MRITFTMQANTYFNTVSSSLNGMMDASNKVTSGRDLTSPEQNATGYISAYNTQRMIDEMNQFSANAENAFNWLTNADTELASALELISAAKNSFAIGGASSDQDAASRLALAGDVAGIYDSLFDIANASYNGRYIFGGFETDTKPFENEGSEIDNVVSHTQNGGEVSTKHVYEDFPELESGPYTIKMTVNNNIATLQVLDESGKPILIDSNGSDEAGANGNKSGTSMTFEYKAGTIIDTGRGITVTMPEDPNTANLTLSFDYKAGSEMAYTGDDNILYSQIGYNEEVAINMPGSTIFSQTYKTIQGTKFNTTFGLPATESTYFSQLDKTNTSFGDSIDLSGTDYNGIPVGSAQLAAPVDAELDLSKATEQERTLMVTYSDQLYKIVVPQAAYKDSEALSDAINQQLKYAEYMGSLDEIPANLDKDLYPNFVANQLTAGAGSVPNDNPTNMLVDLSTQISASPDGGRLNFASSATGDNVRFTITGLSQNALGFDDLTLGANGKDTTFELGKEYSSEYVQTIKTTHDAVDFTNPGHITIDGTLVRLPSVTIDPGTGVQTPSQRELELQINEALRSEGFGFGVTAKIVPTVGGAAGEYDLSLSRTNNNMSAEAELSTTHLDTAGVVDLQKSPSMWVDSVRPDEKTIGDFMSFIEDLYGESVDASIVDGKITLTDLRSGESKTSISIKPQNEGFEYVAYDVNTNLTVKGSYTGNFPDEWQIETNYDNVTGQLDVSIRNQENKVIFESTKQPYFGEDIELPYGLSISPDTSVPNSMTRINVSATPGLEFGNINVIEDGSNINIFRSLTNLEHALKYNIVNNGYSEPTAWENESLKSTATPYLSGDFTGAYNDNWHYEIASGGSNEFYLQNEYKATTGEVRFDPAMLGDIAFEIDYYDKETNTLRQIPINIDLAAATPPLANSEEVQEYILNELNNNQTLLDLDLSFEDKDGTIQINSGSGTAIANFTTTATGADRERTQFILGLDIMKNEALELPITNTPAMNNTTINIGGTDVTIPMPVGGFADEEALELAVNNAIAGAGLTDVQAGLIDGAMVFTRNNIEVEASYNAAVGANDNWLGLAVVTDSQVFSAGIQAPMTDLSESTPDQRTLNFKYNTAAGEQNVAIILPQQAYEDIADMVDEINEQLATSYAPATPDLRAIVAEDGTIAFANDDNSITEGLVVQGDHEGTLGFPAAGDKVTVKVTGENGSPIQELTLDSAGETEDVGDGVKLGFDAGSLFATDSFSTAVGSGIDREISVLDAAEQQILLAVTTVGNRGSRVESTMYFQETLVTNAESDKAGYLGSTEADIAQATTDWNLSITAYESALSVTGRLMSISLLDFLR